MGQIAAAKAFTANGLSSSRSQSFTTAALYAAVQPGGPLFGLDAGNPVDTSVAYKGPQRDWGTAEDPMVGHIVGGTITFGGGDPLFVGNAVVGGIGVFFPGKTGYATESNSELSTTYDPTKPDRTKEAEWIAFAAAGG